MDALNLARWQFAITTVYHFLFVPITIGLSGVVALFHTYWLRTRKEHWLRLTKFYGKLFMINFALGLVTGIVQEFQFGMNWSDYSRFVGDIFGAPLAFEALLSFFLESTFLGVWIFGWGRLPEKLHVASIWLTHIGTVISAYFILAANSFMQNPVGYTFNPKTGRAEMADFVAVLTNKVQLVTFPHVITSAYMVAGGVVLGVAIYLLRKSAGTADADLYRRAVRFGAIFALVASIGVIISGDAQGKIMTEVQPMKMAAAEALYETTTNAPFSVLSVGNVDGAHANTLIKVPGLLSFLATGDFGAEVKGINDLTATQKDLLAKVESQYGQQVSKLAVSPSLTPYVPLTYWSFRWMMGLGFVTMFFAVLALLGIRRGGTLQAGWWKWAAIALPLMPVFANSWGWIFTEVGRQPWLVYGVMPVATGVSPSVSGAEVFTTMVGYTLVYAVLAVIEIKLFLTYVRRGAEPFQAPVDAADQGQDAPLQFAY